MFYLVCLLISSLYAHRNSDIWEMKRSINEESSNKRYKFETLNKKFSSINIKAILNKHLHEIDYTDNDDPNPFNTRLAQLKDINLHAGFQSLAREISPFTNSLEQLIHYKSKILDSISHHLSLKYGDDPWRSWLGILE